jgi:hypothetical protein
VTRGVAATWSQRNSKLLVLAVIIWLTVGNTPGASSAGGATLPDRWMGTWSVRKDLGAPGISALTDAQAKSILGKAIHLSDQSARFGNESCDLPTFMIAQQDMTSFLFDYKLTIEQFHLIGARVETLDVKCKGSVTYRLAVLESGCAIFAQEGHFFQILKQGSRGSLSAKRYAKCMAHM